MKQGSKSPLHFASKLNIAWVVPLLMTVLFLGGCGKEEVEEKKKLSDL